MTSDTRTPKSPDYASIGRIGAYVQQSRHDTRATTAASHAKFLSRFDDLVDPGRKLSERERARRSKAALRAHMLRLQLASAKARKANRQRRAVQQLDKAAPA